MKSGLAFYAILSSLLLFAVFIETANAIKCTEEEQRKMRDAGFSEQKIMELCGENIQSPPASSISPAKEQTGGTEEMPNSEVQRLMDKLLDKHA